MRKKGFYFGALVVTAIVLLFACNKAPDVNGNHTEIEEYFSVHNATLVPDLLPESSSTTTLDVQMNANAINGGSSYVTVNSPVNISKVLVGFRHKFGYYELIPDSTTQTFNFVMLITQNYNQINENPIPVVVAIVDEDDNVSVFDETEVNLMEVGTGPLQVSLSFNNAKDIDLHLIEPAYNNANGEPVSFYDRHIYYGQRCTDTGGELNLDSNAGCSNDGINNENITYGDDAQVVPGTYKVYVDLFANCDPDLATHYVVAVYYEGNLIATKSGVYEVGAQEGESIDEEYAAEHEAFVSFTIGE